MSKGMTGETIRTVVVLVIAVVALVVLWMFFSGYLKVAAFGLENVVKGTKTFFCEKICGNNIACKGIFCLGN